MKAKIAVLTDTNSGITEKTCREFGVFVMPMPVIIDGQVFFEGRTVSREEFFKRLGEGAQVSTSQPAPGELTAAWDSLLLSFDEVLYIPMSGGLSGSVRTARVLSGDYGGRVHVVDNRRISMSLRQSALEAKKLADDGLTADEIAQYLESDALNASIYVTVNTLELLRRSGRVTNAAAAISAVLHIKPVLQIQGDKLDAFDRAWGMNAAMDIMINAVKADREKRFAGQRVTIRPVHSGSDEQGERWRQRVQEAFPDIEIGLDHLSVSVACHTGEGALGIGIMKDILK